MLSVPPSADASQTFRGVQWSHSLTAVSQIKALTDQNKGQQGTLQSLQQEKNVLAQQFKTVKTEIDAMAHQRDSLKGERDQFQGACNELMAKLQQLTEKVKNLEKDFISLNDVRAEAAGFVSAPR